MDPQVYAQIRQAVSQGITTSAWWVSFIIMAVTIAISCICAYLIAYVKKKGEYVATKQAFEDLLAQVRETTEATKQIEAKISRATWVGQSELEYRKEQLEEFYGPIYARLKLSGELYRLWMDHKLQGVNEGIIDTFHRQNEEIKNIIFTKAHLIDGAQIPEVFTRFMTSTTIWNWYTARPDQPWLDQDVASLQESKWPKDFETYIFSATEELKTKLNKLYQKHIIE
jgi:hypothetical protein